MKKILFALIIVAAFIPRETYASETGTVYSNAVGINAEAVVGNSQLGEIKLAANASICDAYANHAIHLQNTNLNMKCGLTGARWHLDYNQHYAWCMSVPDSTRAAFVKAGGDALKICPAQKNQPITYKSRWEKIGGPAGIWASGWVQNSQTCRHDDAGCKCGPGYCGNYRSGQTTSWWPNGCSGARWIIRCTVVPQ